MKTLNTSKNYGNCKHYITLVPILADAGEKGIRIIDMVKKSGIEYDRLAAWLHSHKGGMVEVRNHLYFLSDRGKVLLKTFPSKNTKLAPIYLDVIGAAGEKGISAKDISKKSGIIHDITMAWLNNNCGRFASDRDKVVKVKNGRYGLSKQELIYYRQRHGVLQNGDELDI